MLKQITTNRAGYRTGLNSLTAATFKRCGVFVSGFFFLGA